MQGEGSGESFLSEWPRTFQTIPLLTLPVLCSDWRDRKETHSLSITLVHVFDLVVFKFLIFVSFNKLGRVKPVYVIDCAVIPTHLSSACH